MEQQHEAPAAPHQIWSMVDLMVLIFLRADARTFWRLRSVSSEFQAVADLIISQDTEIWLHVAYTQATPAQVLQALRVARAREGTAEAKLVVLAVSTPRVSLLPRNCFLFRHLKELQLVNVLLHSSPPTWPLLLPELPALASLALVNVHGDFTPLVGGAQHKQQMFNSLAQALPQLRALKQLRLDFSGPSFVGNEERSIAYQQDGLRDACLAGVGQLPRLVDLNLRGHHLTGSCLLDLAAQHLVELTKLSVSSPCLRLMTQAAADAAAAAAQHVRVAAAADAAASTAAAARAARPGAGADLVEAAAVAARTAAAAAQRERTAIREADAAAAAALVGARLAALSGLQQLDLCGMPHPSGQAVGAIDPVLLRDKQHLTRLTRLELLDMELLPSAYLGQRALYSALGLLRSCLRHLSTDGTMKHIVNRDDAKKIRFCSQLTHLSLQRCRLNPHQGNALQEMLQARQQGALQHLGLWAGGPCVDAGQLTTPFPAVNSLSLAALSQVTRLTALTQLTSLSLNDELTAGRARLLQRLPLLRRLVVSELEAAAVPELPLQLEELQLRQPYMGEAGPFLRGQGQSIRDLLGHL